MLLIHRELLTLCTGNMSNAFDYSGHIMNVGLLYSPLPFLGVSFSSYTVPVSLTERLYKPRSVQNRQHAALQAPSCHLKHTKPVPTSPHSAF